MPTAKVLESPATGAGIGKVSPASPEDLAQLLAAFEKDGPRPPSKQSTDGLLWKPPTMTFRVFVTSQRRPKRGGTTRMTPQRQAKRLRT